MHPSIPSFLADALLRQYGEAQAAAIEAGFLADRCVSFRINPLRMAADAVLQQLDAAGLIPQPVAWYPDAWTLPGATEDQLRALPCYENGGIYLQNLSAMIPPLVLHPRAGASILDMAAAPGGKTTQLAALSGDRAMITACERDALRAERLRFNLQRQGLRHATVMQLDARKLDDAFRFDQILLDAPCTGSGTLRLNEEAPRRMEKTWVEKIVRTQAGLLQKALRLLAGGGNLVYATCSILREENELQVVRALETPGVTLVPIDPAAFPGLPLLPTELHGTLCIAPDGQYEGFFVAQLQKR